VSCADWASRGRRRDPATRRKTGRRRGPKKGLRKLQEFLDQLSRTIADDEHVAMMLDQAGWHGSGDLKVPDNITLPIDRGDQFMG
jgi:hypothetical protein